MEFKKGFVYPSKIFDPFGCFMSGELVTIVAESNSGKTTFAMDIIKKNSELGYRGFYINLEFPIETMRQGRWLWNHGKGKQNLTTLDPLTESEQQELEKYVKDMLSMFDYYNNPNGIELSVLINEISMRAALGYDLFIIDTFSRISGNLEEKAREHQNKCMEQLQELAQRLDIAIVMLHHTNRSGTFEGSQKIMDLSNVFIIIEKEERMGDARYRKFVLSKDKFISNNEIEVYYDGENYILYDDYEKNARKGL